MSRSHARLAYDPNATAYGPQRTHSISPGRNMYPTHFFPASRPASVSSFASLSSVRSNSPAPSIYSTAPSTATSVGSRRSSFTVQQRSRSVLPPRPVFTGLPVEIYDCILQQLRMMHDQPYLQSCATCHARDLCHLALTSRAWERAIRPHLFVALVHCVGGGLEC